MEMQVELPNGAADGELHGDKLLMAEQLAVAQPGIAIKMNEIIKRFIALDNFERLVRSRCSSASATHAATRCAEWTERLLAAISPLHKLIR